MCHSQCAAILPRIGKTYPAGMFSPPPIHDNRRLAKFLYWQGWAVTDLADYLGEPRTTVQSWKTRDTWDQAPAIERVETTLEARMVQLIAKDQKTGGDYKEIDLLGRQIERLARVRRYDAGGNECDLNPKIQDRAKASGRKPAKNELTPEHCEKLVHAFRDSLFGYQDRWLAACDERTRMILKSRQIGATWYFAREAIVDAVTTGRNQIFLSASKAQAHVFKQYIIAFVMEATDVRLAGDPIVLWNGATLYFLGSNARTAQGYHGNFYFDEFFWTQNFGELNKVASGMALHKKWRKTYFSTPSSMAHDAYTLWTGALFNRRRPKDQQIKLDVSHAALAIGRRCEDKLWRQIVTIEDAEAGGCDLFDLDELRFEYSPDQYENLLMCQFVDDTKSVFSLSLLQRCMVDSWGLWPDVKAHAARPFGHRPVWIGYDPSLTGDSAGCVVVAPPAAPGGPFRVLERHQFRGLDFEEQAREIEKLTQKYSAAYIGIDTTVIGAAVHQLVLQFYPGACAINYSIEVKARMVLKAQNVMGNGRLQFDAGWVDLAASFMAIKKTITPSGRHTTYQAGRAEDIGHADLAWACMHALDHEPLEGSTARNTSIMEIS